MVKRRYRSPLEGKDLISRIEDEIAAIGPRTAFVRAGTLISIAFQHAPVTLQFDNDSVLHFRWP